MASKDEKRGRARSSSPQKHSATGMSSRKAIVLGVCAMEKSPRPRPEPHPHQPTPHTHPRKTASKPMQEILGRLPAQVFKIVVFDEKTILEEPVERWPICECLIAFHSKGFPLGKAIDYATLRKPFVVNDLKRQYALQDRRSVYETLVKARAGESEIPNFKGSDLGRFPLVSADFWTSDHLSERSRSVGAVSDTRARATLTLKRR